MYVRVSTQRQAQTQTIEQQIERLAKQAQQQGWNVPLENVFRDDGHSGSTLKRPGLDRLRDRVARRELDLIAMTAPDRQELCTSGSPARGTGKIWLPGRVFGSAHEPGPP